MNLELRTLSTPDELSRMGADWDDLWERSDVKLPTLRSAPLLAWLADFAPKRRFRAVVVREGARLVAALPLVDMHRGGRMGIGVLPNNYWSASGDLMLDSSVNGSAAMDLLVAGLRKLPWPLLRLTQIDTDNPAWSLFFAATGTADMAIDRSDMYQVGRIQFHEDAKAYHAARPRRHRQNMRRAERMADDAGGMRLQVRDCLQPEEVEPLLRSAFEIEDRGWKGRAGTSVLKSPALWEHYLQQARLLAASGHLWMVFLEHEGRPVAFEYSFVAKGQYFTPKASYDEDFARLSPGQLLCQKLYTLMADMAEPPIVDLMGPLNDAEKKWNTHQYTAEAAMIALKPVRGRALLSAIRGFKQLRAALRRIELPAKLTTGRDGK